MNYFFFNSINNFLSFSLWIFISCWWISFFFFLCFRTRQTWNFFLTLENGEIASLLYLKSCELFSFYVLEKVVRCPSISWLFHVEAYDTSFSKSTDSFWRYYRIRMNNEKCKYFQLIFNHGENSTRNSAMKLVFCCSWWLWWRIFLFHWPDEFTSMHFVEWSGLKEFSDVLCVFDLREWDEHNLTYFGAWSKHVLHIEFEIWTLGSLIFRLKIRLLSLLYSTTKYTYNSYKRSCFTIPLWPLHDPIFFVTKVFFFLFSFSPSHDSFLILKCSWTPFLFRHSSSSSWFSIESVMTFLILLYISVSCVHVLVARVGECFDLVVYTLLSFHMNFFLEYVLWKPPRSIVAVWKC